MLNICATPNTGLRSTEVYSKSNTVVQPPTFLHNPLHDLESVWWLLVWTLLRFHPESDPTPDYDTLQDQLEVFVSLFPGTQVQRRVSPEVATMSEDLVAMYKTVEASFPIPNTAFDGFHGAVLETLNLIYSKVANISVGKLIPIQDTLMVLEQRRGEVVEVMLKQVAL